MVTRSGVEPASAWPRSRGRYKPPNQSLPGPANVILESPLDVTRHFSFIAAPAVGPALLLRAFPDAKQKPVLGVERKLDDRSWANAETALTAELRSLLARCQQALRDGEVAFGRQRTRGLGSVVNPEALVWPRVESEPKTLGTDPEATGP